MTVRKLLYWTAAEGAGSRQAYESLVNVLLALQASSPARCAVHCSTFRPLQAAGTDGLQRPADPAVTRDLCSVTFSDQPRSLLLVTRSQRSVLEGDSELQQLLDKLRLYQLRATLQLEGLRYGIGDFSVGVARAVQKPLEEFRGIVLDVAYHPLDRLAAAEPILQDFCSVLLEEAAAVGAVLRVAGADMEGFGLPERYSLQHTAVQYVQLMVQLLGEGGKQ